MRRSDRITGAAARSALRAVRVAVLSLLAIPAAAQDAPARVVSMNLCSDQYAMLLAAPGQLVSVSHVARDPFSSPLWREAQDYPVNHGGAEEIFLMRPDLVLANEWSDPTVIALLRRLGVDVIQFKLVNSMDEVPERLLEVGAALGREAEAEQVADAYRQRLTAMRASAPAARRTAAFFYANGYSLGEGGLAGEILDLAGYDNIAAEMGIPWGGVLPLETLVMADPDLIIRAAPYKGASRSEEIMTHPALAALRGARPGARSGSDWGCGTPLVLDAVEAMRAVSP